MSGKHWIVFAVVVAGLVGGMFYLSSQNKLDTSDIDKAKTMAIFEAEDRNGQIGDHVFGNVDSKVTLIEYGDFQCNPGCRVFHENIAPIMQDEHYKDNFRLVYRHFPITNSHPNAMAAAATAEAAGLQGKFWEMWDALFTNQAQWSVASAEDRGGLFEGYATGLGLNLDKFREDMQSEAVSKKIKFDKSLASIANVTGTPTIFINGEQAENVGSTQAIKDLLDKAIEEASSK